MRVAVLAVAIVLAVMPLRGWAQDDQTLADIRQELSVLYVEVQRLKRELSTTGAPGGVAAGNSVLERVDAIERELTRLTDRTEQLDLRINRVVQDGTNRIGDLEFRLVELEGGDVSQLGETTTLGGPAENTGGAALGGQTSQPETQLAIGEQADFDAAQKALAGGEYRAAADQFSAFTSTYPGSPLASQADLERGRALDGLGDTREAARAYLASFSADANGPVAPDALSALGAALGRLGQIQQACVTLGEVEVRFPQSPAVDGARKEMAALGCT